MKALLLVLLLAVVPATQSQESNRCKESADKATAYFYRVDEHVALQKGLTRLRINGSKILKMPEGNYVGFYLAPGQHELTMGRRESDYLLNAEAGKIYFFRISHTYHSGLSLTPMPEDQATYQMKPLKPLSPDNLQDKQIQRCNTPQP